MLKKILVPLDGSKLADRILGQVRRLLLREDAEVRLLRVLPEAMSYESSGRQRHMVAQAQEHLESHCEVLNGQGARASFVTLTSGDPAAKILAYAAKYQPSLIAMSTHGRTGLRRWTRGSVAERVLRGSPFPLLLWNAFRAGSVREPRFRKILVPLDGSEASAEVLPKVAEIARLYEARVVLFHVTEFYPLAADAWVATVPPTPEEVVRMLAPFRKRLKGIRTSIKSVLGIPAASILDAAQEEGADLVAMATHGRSGTSRWAFGSVAEQVLRHTHLPLLIERTIGLSGR